MEEIQHNCKIGAKIASPHNVKRDKEGEKKPPTVNYKFLFKNNFYDKYFK